MAVTGNKSGSFNGQYPSYATPYIFWSYEQSIPYNNTVLTAELKVKREKTGSTTYKATTPWSMTIGGTKTSGNVNFKITNVSAGEYITIGKASKTFTHKDDGSIDAIAVSATIDLSGTTLGTGSVSASIPINTIPRASEPTFSASSVAMGSSITITTNRKSDSFTHTLIYKFGNATGTIASGVGASITWTPSLDLAKQIPNGSEGTCTITCQTYNGSDLVGTKTTTLKLTVPNTVKPVINSVTISEGGTAVPSSWGVYVKGKSALKVVISASGVYGSSITGYKITGIDSITYNESNFTSAVLQEAKTYTVKVVVTDSRGRTIEKETQVVCVAYNNPLISVATVTRCNADGSANATGTSVKYTFKASVSPVNNKNTYAYKLGYKKSTDSYFTYIDIANSSYTLDKSNVVISGVTFSSSISYNFDFFVSDYFTSTSNTSNNIKSGYKLVNFNKSGKGIAFGKFSEADNLDIALPTNIRGPAGEKPLRVRGIVGSDGNGNDGELHLQYGANQPIKLGNTAAYNISADGSTYSGTAASANTATKVTCGPRNSSATWIPVWRDGNLEYTLRRFYNSTAHTNYPNEQDNLATMEFLSFWNGAYNSGGSSNLYRCAGGAIVPEKAKSIVANDSGTKSYIVLGNLLICWGRVTITPSAANTPTSAPITFPRAFASQPAVLTGTYSEVPGKTVTGTSYSAPTTTGCTLWVTRTNTTATYVTWVAIGQAS